ncbi:MAG: hypothetical protein N3F67_01445 [Acidilobaceae archaeon]|nr:hypothetical protein [Acidilobaceae archaeon]
MKLVAYLGVDWRSRLTERVLKDLSVYLASHYGLGMELDFVELPLGDMDEEELPLVILEGEVISKGEVPSMSYLVEAVFERLGSQVRTKLLGFPELEA